MFKDKKPKTKKEDNQNEEESVIVTDEGISGEPLSDESAEQKPTKNELRKLAKKGQDTSVPMFEKHVKRLSEMSKGQIDYHTRTVINQTIAKLKQVEESILWIEKSLGKK
jgi:hypothetical protein